MLNEEMGKFECWDQSDALDSYILNGDLRLGSGQLTYRTLLVGFIFLIGEDFLACCWDGSIPYYKMQEVTDSTRVC